MTDVTLSLMTDVTLSLMIVVTLSLMTTSPSACNRICSWCGSVQFSDALDTQFDCDEDLKRTKTFFLFKYYYIFTTDSMCDISTSYDANAL